jgi:hypothetical protein
MPAEVMLAASKSAGDVVELFVVGIGHEKPYLVIRAVQHKKKTGPYERSPIMRTRTSILYRRCKPEIPDRSLGKWDSQVFRDLGIICRCMSIDWSAACLNCLTNRPIRLPLLDSLETCPRCSRRRDGEEYRGLHFGSSGGAMLSIARGTRR